MEEGRVQTSHPHVVCEGGRLAKVESLENDECGRMCGMVVVGIKKVCTRHLVVLTDRGAVDHLHTTNETFYRVRVRGSPHMPFLVSVCELRAVHSTPPRL